MKKLLFIVLGFFFITGCRQSGQKMEATADMAEVSTASPMEKDAGDTPEMNPVASQQSQPVQPSLTPAVMHKKIIRDGSLTLKVKDIIAVRKQVDSIVFKMGGYVGSESFNSYEQESSYNIIIRVPAAQFDRLVERLEKGTGEVLFKDISARDVTEEFVDLEIRLANKRKFNGRYAELLKKAGSVKEILEIEENIRKIEEEIESTEGRLRYLSDQVAYSKLTLTLTQQKEYKYKPRQARNSAERLKESLHEGWKGFVSFLLFLLRIWPFWILAVIGWALYRRYKRRKKITTGFKKN